MEFMKIDLKIWQMKFKLFEIKMWMVWVLSVRWLGGGGGGEGDDAEDDVCMLLQLMMMSSTYYIMPSNCQVERWSPKGERDSLYFTCGQLHTHCLAAIATVTMLYMLWQWVSTFV